ncbi:hypothetical protein T484DRAFT_1849651 [Baffinella frigidus]|nr:hypothetical protein T484DRAFT_1849651 [Cryptophyta sp. CCMP2293]
MYAAMRAALESPEGVALALWWAVEAADEAGVRRAAQRGADLDAPAGQALVAAHGGGAPQSNGSNDSGSNGNGSNGKSALDSNGSNGTGAWESQTPLHAAAARGYVKVLRALTECGANVIRALAECGANVNACNARGFTPLHFAAFHSRTLAAVTLVELGADLLARNFVPQAGGARLTPVDVAAGDTATVLLKLMKVKARRRGLGRSKELPELPRRRTRALTLQGGAEAPRI